MVPPCSGRIARVPPYSRPLIALSRTGLSPDLARLSRRFRSNSQRHWPGPRSLATTNGVSFDVLSSGYLDVSVPRVRSKPLWIQGSVPSSDPPSCNTIVADDVTQQRIEGGFPHSEIPGSTLVRSSPRLIAAYHVLHRLSAPRHPPDALITLDCSHDPWPPQVSSPWPKARPLGREQAS